MVHRSALSLGRRLGVLRGGVTVPSSHHATSQDGHYPHLNTPDSTSVRLATSQHPHPQHVIGGACVQRCARPEGAASGGGMVMRGDDGGIVRMEGGRKVVGVCEGGCVCCVLASALGGVDKREGK